MARLHHDWVGVSALTIDLALPEGFEESFYAQCSLSLGYRRNRS